MSSTNHTPNYNLPQYVGTDKPTFLGDFNNAMSAIDTALHNNAQNAGEGLSELQQAQAALTETQETLTEVQTEVANVSGIAATVNQNVQQALSAANDATTAANNATSQIQPAVTAANQASSDAQAAQQVANGNVATLNELSERVSALENKPQTTMTKEFSISGAAQSAITTDVTLEGYTPVTAGISEFSLDLQDNTPDRGCSASCGVSGNNVVTTFNIQSGYAGTVNGTIKVAYQANS